jgi:uncharacterized membrane protein
LGTLIVTWETHFDFLVLNTFLAYLPIECAFQVQRIKNGYVQLLFGFLWLLFFPNIPYLVTDIVHADLLGLYNNLTGMSLETIRGWGLILILFLVIFAYIYWGFMEFFALMTLVKEKFQLSKWVIIGAVPVICWLSSMAMYAGRFAPRLHSVHFFTNPLYVLEVIFAHWTMKKFEFICLFFLLHLGIIGILWITNGRQKEAN